MPAPSGPSSSTASSRWCAGFALTPLGAARLASSQPLDRRARGGEPRSRRPPKASRFLDATGGFALRAPADLDAHPARRSPSKGARSSRCACSAWPIPRLGRATCGAASARRAAAFPLLAAIAEGAASFEHEIARRPRARSTRPARWSTTPARSCASIRDRLRKQRARLRGTLESYLRGKDTAKYLQEQIVTDRNGRYVLVVRAEHRTAIPGIVHGSSAQRRQPLSSSR